MKIIPANLAAQLELVQEQAGPSGPNMPTYDI